MILELSSFVVIHSLWGCFSSKRSGSLVSHCSQPEAPDAQTSPWSADRPPPSTTASCSRLPPRRCGQVAPCTLTCDCSLFSGPQSSSVLNHGPLIQDGARLCPQQCSEPHSVLSLLGCWSPCQTVSWNRDTTLDHVDSSLSSFRDFYSGKLGFMVSAKTSVSA